MEIHVVARPEAGYAREDPSGVGVVGAYIDAGVARKVKTLSGSGATISTIELNAVPPGFLKDAPAFGITFENAPSPAVLPENWAEEVRKAWLCVRQHDHTIPDEVLDMMKDVLLAYPQRA